MQRWRVSGTVAGSKYLGEVEADTPEGAKEKAFAELDCSVNLCHQCADECEDAEVQELHVWVEEVDA